MQNQSIEFSALNEPLPQVNKNLFSVVFLVTLVTALALLNFSAYVIGMIGVLIFLVGVYNFPELGVGLFVNGLFLVGYFWKGLGVTFLITPLAVVLCTMGLVHYIWNNGLKWRFGILPAIVLLIGVLLFIGILYSPLPAQGLVKTGRYLSMNLFIFFAIMLFTGDLNKLKNLLKIIAFIGFVIAIISIIYIGFIGLRNISRFTLPGQNAIWFARGLGISVLATFFWMEFTQKKFQKLVFIAFVCLMLSLIYLTASRGPLLALLGVLVFYFLILQRGKYNLFKTIFLVFLISLSLKLIVSVASGQIFHRMLSLFTRFDLTTFLRLQAFHKAETLFFNNPILGVGTGGFEHFSILVYPHNVFLELASELGILGVMAFIIMIIYAIFLGFRLLRSQKDSTLALNLSKVFLALLFFSLINSQISGDISGNYELWFSVAGIWTLYSTKERLLKR